MAVVEKRDDLAYAGRTFYDELYRLKQILVDDLRQIVDGLEAGLVRLADVKDTFLRRYNRINYLYPGFDEEVCNIRERYVGCMIADSQNQYKTDKENYRRGKKRKIKKQKRNPEAPIENIGGWNLDAEMNDSEFD